MHDGSSEIVPTSGAVHAWRWKQATAPALHPYLEQRLFILLAFIVEHHPGKRIVVTAHPAGRLCHFDKATRDVA
eukprot:360680-Chlamydomonas_euryale.AAC.6